MNTDQTHFTARDGNGARFTVEQRVTGYETFGYRLSIEVREVGECYFYASPQWYELFIKLEYERLNRDTRGA